MNKQEININTNIIFDLQDYMFTSRNIERYSKHMIQFFNQTNDIIKPKASNKFIEINDDTKIYEEKIINSKINSKRYNKNAEKKKETMYKPNQKDTLFWCFYILKNGYSKYEMEINNQYFVIEKSEKFKYIEILRKRKDTLKIHKIKPLIEIEDDLANKDKISIKTFFALCIIENINVLLVDKRKVFEVLCNDIDNTHPINIIHKNNSEYSIEIEPTDEIIKKYRETYYKMNSFDSTLKSISSYKLDELINICKKLEINIEQYKMKQGNQKLTKKDIYELLVLNY